MLWAFVIYAHVCTTTVLADFHHCRLPILSKLVIICETWERFCELELSKLPSIADRFFETVNKCPFVTESAVRTNQLSG